MSKDTILPYLFVLLLFYELLQTSKFMVYIEKVLETYQEDCPPGQMLSSSAGKELEGIDHFGIKRISQILFHYTSVHYDFWNLGALILWCAKCSKSRYKRVPKKYFEHAFLVFKVNRFFNYDNHYLDTADANSTATGLEKYYWQSFYHWAPIFPYNQFGTVILLILMKLGTYSWVFGDILVIVLSRAVTERLKMFHEIMKCALNPNSAMVFITPEQLITRSELG